MKATIAQGNLSIENHPTKHKGRARFKATRAALCWAGSMILGRTALATVAALLLVMIMSGCASTNWNDGDPYKYNEQTGYPFIGGPFGLQ